MKHISGKAYRRMRTQRNMNFLKLQYTQYCKVLLGRGEEPLEYRKWLHIPARGNY